ncbi:hypothetical protein GALMADRAFT_148712 [Galerina marginata CBS 339.88]|uniref:Uncharacterized protein n=1 Tax=Galerina marginata (strain CBS 339.88) TaxID=685588 RepID=A0A067SF69_GALM3|nr:hypothetical protein GALMADRAFT_148712 [Galerina marginata CBS 339.88]
MPRIRLTAITNPDTSPSAIFAAMPAMDPREAQAQALCELAGGSDPFLDAPGQDVGFATDPERLQTRASAVFRDRTRLLLDSLERSENSEIPIPTSSPTGSPVRKKLRLDASRSALPRPAFLVPAGHGASSSRRSPPRGAFPSRSGQARGSSATSVVGDIRRRVDVSRRPISSAATARAYKGLPQRRLDRYGRHVIVAAGSGDDSEDLFDGPDYPTAPASSRPPTQSPTHLGVIDISSESEDDNGNGMRQNRTTTRSACEAPRSAFEAPGPVHLGVIVISDSESEGATVDVGVDTESEGEIRSTTPLPASLTQRTFSLVVEQDTDFTHMQTDNDETNDETNSDWVDSGEDSGDGILDMVALLFPASPANAPA